MSTGQFHGWYIIGALANDFAAVGVDQAISRDRFLEKIAQSFLDRSPTWISFLLTTFSNPFSGASRTLQKHCENTPKFGSCPLRSKTLVFPGFFAFLGSSFGRL